MDSKQQQLTTAVQLAQEQEGEGERLPNVSQNCTFSVCERDSVSVQYKRDPGATWGLRDPITQARYDIPRTDTHT
jgi:hypothetical protein